MNTVISYNSLSLDLKKAFRNWLDLKPRDLISFPFKGKHMKGYIFDYDQKKYLVVMQLQLDDATISTPEIENLNLNEEM